MKLCCRHLNHDTSPSIGGKSACDLADALAEAPALLAIMPCKDWTALAGGNRKLRTVIHSTVHAIAVNTFSDVRHCVKGMWQHLAVIKVKAFITSQAICNPQLPEECNFELIAALVSEYGHNAMAWLVRSNTQPSELDPCQRIAAAHRTSTKSSLGSRLTWFLSWHATSMSEFGKTRGVDKLARTLRWTCASQIVLPGLCERRGVAALSLLCDK